MLRVMKASRFNFASTLACCALLLSGGARAGDAAELLISQRLLADGSLEVAYTPPPGQRELKFFDADSDAHQRWRGAMMKPQGSCTELTDTSIRLRASPECRTAVVRIQARTLALDATYEPAQPLSDGSGVLAYSGHVAVLLKGQALRWRWSPPQGGIVIHQGRVFRAPVEQRASAEQVDQALAGAPFEVTREIGAAQYAYIGSAKGLELLAGGNLLLDPGLDRPRAERISRVLKYSLERLSKLYGIALPGPGAVVTAVSELPGFHGDTTSGRMMRLRLPTQVETMPGTTLERFVTHEVVHWWNSGVFGTDQQRPWLHEGHAEWMARLLMREQGLIGDEELRADIESNLNNCVIARGSKAAAAMKPGRQGDDVYACGMSLMLLGQAQRNAFDRKTVALAQMAPLHRMGRVLDVGAFVEWADAGSPQAAMAQLLQDPKQAFDSGLLAQLKALGIADGEDVKRSEQMPQGLRIKAAGSLMSALMSSDCNGAVGFWTLPKTFRLDTQFKCSSLRLGEEVLTLAGVEVLADPMAAYAAVASACQQAQGLKVGYTSGAETTLACPTVLPALPLSQLIRLRPDALRRLSL